MSATVWLPVLPVAALASRSRAASAVRRRRATHGRGHVARRVPLRLGRSRRCATRGGATHSTRAIAVQGPPARRHRAQTTCRNYSSRWRAFGERGPSPRACAARPCQAARRVRGPRRPETPQAQCLSRTPHPRAPSRSSHRGSPGSLALHPGAYIDTFTDARQQQGRPPGGPRDTPVRHAQRAVARSHAIRASQQAGRPAT